MRLRRGVLDVLVLAAGLAPAALVATPVQPGCDARAAAMIAALNATRARHGLAPLVPDGRLMQAARTHADDLAAGPGTGHAGTDGSTPSKRVLRAGYGHALVGEVLAHGLASPPQVVEGWLGSPGHRALVLESRFTDVGVAYSRSSRAHLRDHWVADFGTRAEGAVVPWACVPPRPP